MFNFVNEDLSLVNEKGETVDTEGRRIDKNGFWYEAFQKRKDTVTMVRETKVVKILKAKLLPWSTAE